MTRPWARRGAGTEGRLPSRPPSTVERRAAVMAVMALTLVRAPRHPARGESRKAARRSWDDPRNSPDVSPGGSRGDRLVVARWPCAGPASPASRRLGAPGPPGVSRTTPLGGVPGWPGSNGLDTLHRARHRPGRDAVAQRRGEPGITGESPGRTGVSSGPGRCARPTRTGREGPAQPRTSGRAPLAVTAASPRRRHRASARRRGARQARWYRGALPRAGCQPGPAGAASSS